MDRQMNDQMDKWQMEGQMINEQKNDIIMIGQDDGQNNVQMGDDVCNRKMNREAMTDWQIKEG